MPSAAEKRKFLELQLSYKKRKIEEIENENPRMKDIFGLEKLHKTFDKLFYLYSNF